MTSKVVELREKWFDGLKYEFSGMLQGMSGDLDSLLAKIHAEGVAEGEEKANERIKAWLKNLDNPALERVILPMRAYYRFNVDVDALIEFIDAASVLAPTKESEK